ncbi:transketolase family protein [Chloroflexota bacterium]
MRAGFISVLMELAKEDENIFLLVADVGYRLVEPFAEQFPGRFVNIGIAEQNMIGIAAGLALSGKTVFTYSIANFPTLRCLEQIRNDVCYHNCNVKIVSSGGGLIYGALGTTHHVTEDAAIMRTLPNMTVVSPGDPKEAALATRSIARLPGPCYLRLGRTGDPEVHRTDPDFQIGKAIKVLDGNDITLIASGGILPNVVQAAEQLSEQSIKARVLSMHTLKPLDKEAVISAAEETGVIITIEEHNITGGLGSAVAETLLDTGSTGARLVRMGIPDMFTTRVGNRDYLLDGYSLSVEGIVESVNNTLKYRKQV